MVATLQSLCFNRLVEELEHYPVELLSLLPLSLRRQLILRLPLVDICHLEQTTVFDGLDCETIWGEIYGTQFTRYFRHISLGTDDEDYPEDVDSLIRGIRSESKKELYLTILTQIILNNLRPTGYFGHFIRDYDTHERAWAFYGHFSCNAPGAVERASDDIVNYLVASCQTNPFALFPEVPLKLLAYSSFNNSDDSDDDSDEAFANAIPRHLVYKHPIAPSELYEKACRQWQLVPPRYASLLQHNSRRLPDLEALRLLMEGCNFHPKAVAICTSLLRSAQYYWVSDEAVVADLLSQLFSKVEKLFLRGDDDCVLKAVFANRRPVLCTLHLDEFDTAQLLPYLSQKELDGRQQCLPGEVSKGGGKSYTGLKELVIQFDTLSHLNVQSPQADDIADIIECQSNLQCLKICIAYLHQSPKLQNALVSFVKRPQYLLHLESTGLSFLALQEILAAFLASPCHGSQTLHFSRCKISSKNGNVSHAMIQEATPSCALEHKSLIFEDCSIGQQLVDMFLSFPKFHLNCLTFSYSSFYEPTEKKWLSVVAQHPNTCIENLTFDGVSLSGATKEDCEALLQNPALRKLDIELCDLSLEVFALGLKKVATSNLSTLVVRDPSSMRLEVMMHHDEPPPLNALFFEVLFSLPNLPQMEVKIDLAMNEDGLQLMHEVWKKSSCTRLKHFSVPFARYLPEKLGVTIIREMGICSKLPSDKDYEFEDKPDFIEKLYRGKTEVAIHYL